MDIFLSVLIPALLLAYYLRIMWADAKDKRVLVGLLAGGTILFYAGLFFNKINPGLESILKLTGACLFFTTVAINSRRPKDETPDQSLHPDKNSDYPEN